VIVAASSITLLSFRLKTRLSRRGVLRAALAALGAAVVFLPNDTIAQTLRLTVDEAVARAKANPANFDPTDLNLAKAQLVRSGVLLPSNPFFGGGAQRTSQMDVPNNYAFFLQQEFEIAGQRGKRVEAATQAVAQQEWQQRQAQLTLAATVKSTFVTALIHQSRVTLAERSLDATRELTAEVTRKRSTSDTERIERNIAEIQETRAERRVAASERDRDVVLSTLRQLVGVPPEQPLELVGSPQTEVKEIPSLELLTARALGQRPDAIALRHGVHKADLELTVQEREKIPNITLFGSISRFEDDFLAGGDLGFPIPVFQRGTADVLEAATERNRAGAELQRLERTIQTEVTDAYRAYLVAAGDLTALHQVVVPKSEENVEIEQRLFDKDEVEASDLIGIQTDLLTARGDYLDALEAYNDALIELERVVGGPLD